MRAATAADAEAIAAIYAPHVLNGIASFETEPPEADAIQSRMAASEGLYPWIVATNGGHMEEGVQAYAYASKFRERPAYRFVVETTIYVAGDAQGRGLGRRLYQTLLDTVRAQGFTQAIGAIALPNEASVAVHKALGFRRAGIVREVGFKAGRWVDVGYWQCRLADGTIPPKEPVPFSEVGVVQV